MNLRELLSLREHYQLADALFDVLENPPALRALCDEILAGSPDLSREAFLAEFEAHCASRKDLKQDYTPPELAALAAQLVPAGSAADVCAGTGALTIAAWAEDPAREVYCEEFSRPAAAVLLLNLALRGISGTVRHGDALTGETFALYRTEAGTVRKIAQAEARKYAAVVSNPPFSMPWTPTDRFAAFGTPPKSKADFAFVLHGFDLLQDGGRMAVILPTGVLFRGQAEGAIRQKLLEAGAVETVIGLPDKLFSGTGIPVCLLVLAKGRQERDVLFIDASRCFEKQAAKNRLTETDRILQAVKDRREALKFAHRADFSEIEGHGYNLSISRYVDTFEAEILPPLREIADELNDIQRQINAQNDILLRELRQLRPTSGDPADIAEWEAFVSSFEKLTALEGEGRDTSEALLEQKIARLQDMKKVLLRKMFA